MNACAACRHPFAAHDARQGFCRLGGCGCGGYDSGEPEIVETGPRRVCVDVPDGFAVTFQLVPVAQAEEADG